MGVVVCCPNVSACVWDTLSPRQAQLASNYNAHVSNRPLPLSCLGNERRTDRLIKICRVLLCLSAYLDQITAKITDTLMRSSFRGCFSSDRDGCSLLGSGWRGWAATTGGVGGRLRCWRRCLYVLTELLIVDTILLRPHEAIYRQYTPPRRPREFSRPSIQIP